MLVWFFIVSFTHKVENLKYNISNKINDPKSFLWQQIALLLLWEKRVCNVGEKRENKKRLKNLHHAYFNVASCKISCKMPHQIWGVLLLFLLLFIFIFYE